MITVKYWPAGSQELRSATVEKVSGGWSKHGCLFRLIDIETGEHLSRPWFAIQGSSPYGTISTAPPRRRPNWESVARPLREKEQ